MNGALAVRMCDVTRGREAAKNLLYFSRGGMDDRCDRAVWEKAVGTMGSLSRMGLAECWLALSRSVEGGEQVPLMKLKTLFEMAMMESASQGPSAPSVDILHDALERSILLAEQFWDLIRRVDAFGDGLGVKIRSDQIQEASSGAATPAAPLFTPRSGSVSPPLDFAGGGRIAPLGVDGGEALRACCDRLAAMIQASHRQMERVMERMDELERGVVGRLEAAFKGRIDELERGVVGRLEAALKGRLDELERGVVGRLEAALKGRLDELERGMAGRLDAAIRGATEARPAAADPPPVPRAPDSTTVRPAAGGIRPAGYRTAAAPKAEPSRNSLSPEHSRGSIVHEPVFRPAGVVDYSRADNDIRRTDLQYFHPADRDDALLLRTDTERFTSPTSPFSSPRRSASRLA
jgi:hypothetical protein